MRLHTLAQPNPASEQASPSLSEPPDTRAPSLSAKLPTFTLVDPGGGGEGWFDVVGATIFQTALHSSLCETGYMVVVCGELLC